MTFITLIYIVLLVIFGVFAGFIFRHVVRYGYLSPRFKVVVIIFGLMAATIVVFSLYLVLQLYRSNDAGIDNAIPSITNENGINF